VKIDLRWQLLLAVVCLALVVALLGIQVKRSGLCTAQVPSPGGKLAEGIIGRPQFLNPILDESNPVDSGLNDLIFDGLTRYAENGHLEPALASGWQFNDEGTRVTFQLRDDVLWHDGRPFTAADVAFTYGLLKAGDTEVDATVRELWDSVSINVVDDNQVEFVLPRPYAPFLEATTRGILPEHVLGEADVSDLGDHSFNRNPVGTGPFLVAPGNDWQQMGFLRLVPNPHYWREGVQLDVLEYRFYEDASALAAAYEEGEIQAISGIPSDAIEQIAPLPGIRLFTTAAPRMTQLVFNLSTSGAPAVRSREMRQALAQALDREALVDEAMNGQGVPLEGPYLPSSWAYKPGSVTSYAYDATAAGALLDSAGWTRQEGETLRSRDDTLLTLRLLFSGSAGHQALASEIRDQWAEVGIQTELVVVPANELRTALSQRDFDVALVDVEPPGDPDLYDFWSQEAIVDGQNFGAWNDRWASEALEAARQIASDEERQPFYDAFLRFFDEDLPALTLFQHVYTYGINEAVNDAEIGRILTPRDRYETLPAWFLIYREIAVDCPEDPDDEGAGIGGSEPERSA
jgi:peptide/nickel transport system substrate-binding protein